ncbi:MAG: NUDIX hydrolase [Candidatus Magasanikbacteria bacterium CG10_big_fil_rev_8_21_14_0_10_47_10]|uniref:NUDIX hydrolase n=1 Tax=Candidatus Magasanikbacteria bacterium CG10_big_fil_rev_8_21_14_0_10_47_10 TaxID=1974652 RepID=A0A2H0TS71_9BACT|nr:MAG: NUDIX hydrolase [Candidatus Magasanikbacteria bacterium CG10_big_fil_rev_8_21_14_0_10_47_10]
MIKKINEHILHEDTWQKIHLDDVALPDGTFGTYAYLDSVAGAFVIAQRDDGKILVLREWRYPIQGWTWCFPAGGVEENETPLETAKRELKEETGVEAVHWDDLGDLRIDPGKNKHTAQFFYATGLTEGKRGAPEPGELHEVHWLSIVEIETAIQSGEINNGWLLSGYAKLMVRLH